MKTPSSFLRNPSNSLFREAMFRHDLLHSIYHECAKTQRNIHIYEPEIDVSGFDIVLDDLFNTLRFQLKSKLTDSKTRSWNVHKVLLRPNFSCLNSLPFSNDSGGLGYMGGVILIRASVTNEGVFYSYLYTDVLVICAMNRGIYGPSSASCKKSIGKIFQDLTRPDYRSGTIALSETAFWEFASLTHLLEFAGLNMGSPTAVRDNIHRCISSLYRMTPMRNESRLTDDASISTASDLLSNFLKKRGAGYNI